MNQISQNEQDNNHDAYSRRPRSVTRTQENEVGRTSSLETGDWLLCPKPISGALAEVPVPRVRPSVPGQTPGKRIAFLPKEPNPKNEHIGAFTCVSYFRKNPVPKTDTRLRTIAPKSELQNRHSRGKMLLRVMKTGRKLYANSKVPLFGKLN